MVRSASTGNTIVSSDKPNYSKPFTSGPSGSCSSQLAFTCVPVASQVPCSAVPYPIQNEQMYASFPSPAPPMHEYARANAHAQPIDSVVETSDYHHRLSNAGAIETGEDRISAIAQAHHVAHGTYAPMSSSEQRSYDFVMPHTYSQPQPTPIQSIPCGQQFLIGCIPFFSNVPCSAPSSFY